MEGEEIRRNDPVEYFLPMGRKYLFCPRGVMAIEVPKNEEISGGENGAREGVGSAIHWGGENRGGSIHIKIRERGVVEMLTPTLSK